MEWKGVLIKVLLFKSCRWDLLLWAWTTFHSSNLSKRPQNKPRQLWYVDALLIISIHKSCILPNTQSSLTIYFIPKALSLTKTRVQLLNIGPKEAVLCFAPFTPFRYALKSGEKARINPGVEPRGGSKLYIFHNQETIWLPPVMMASCSLI